jgi:hypothetical protein
VGAAAPPGARGRAMGQGSDLRRDGAARRRSLGEGARRNAQATRRPALMARINNVGAFVTAAASAFLDGLDGLDGFCAVIGPGRRSSRPGHNLCLAVLRAVASLAQKPSKSAKTSTAMKFLPRPLPFAPCPLCAENRPNRPARGTRCTGNSSMALRRRRGGSFTTGAGHVAPRARCLTQPRTRDRTGVRRVGVPRTITGQRLRLRAVGARCPCPRCFLAGGRSGKRRG